MRSEPIASFLLSNKQTNRRDGRMYFVVHFRTLSTKRPELTDRGNDQRGVLYLCPFQRKSWTVIPPVGPTCIVGPTTWFGVTINM